MSKFVWLAVPGQKHIPVNPDQVQYLRIREGETVLVFGAGAHGLHEVVVTGPINEIVVALGGTPLPEPAPAPDEAASRPPRRKTPAPA